MFNVKSLLWSMALVGCLQFSCTAQEPKTEELPAPTRSGGKPIMEAFNNRHTERKFLNDKQIPKQILSNLLWATWGVNRDDGRHTAPTAKNNQEIEVYVAKADGLWRYDPANNALVLFQAGDARLGRFKEAPVMFYYVAPDNDHWAPMHVGSLYQNAGLYCASVGLGNVVLGSVDKEINAKYTFPKGWVAIAAQAFGWPEGTKRIDPSKMPKNPGRGPAIPSGVDIKK